MVTGETDHIAMDLQPKCHIEIFRNVTFWPVGNVSEYNFPVVNATLASDIHS